LFMIFKGFKGSSLPACGPKSSAEGSAGMGSWVLLNADFGLQIAECGIKIPNSAFRIPQFSWIFPSL
jgi:hypothetical protein